MILDTKKAERFFKEREAVHDRVSSGCVEKVGVIKAR